MRQSYLSEAFELRSRAEHLRALPENCGGGCGADSNLEMAIMLEERARNLEGLAKGTHRIVTYTSGSTSIVPK